MTTTTKACVIGWPISHSRSPMIHGYWLKNYGISGEYKKEAVAPEDLADFITSLKNLGYMGANVTVPHKETAYALADSVNECAKAVKAANTLWMDGEKICAANTDTYGCMTNLEEKAPGWDKNLQSAVILGAGGASRAVLYGLIKHGVPEIRIVNRTKARAEELANEFEGNINIYEWSDLEKALTGSSLLINTTTLGMVGSPALEIDLSPMNEKSVIYDIVYDPLETELLKQARKLNFTPVDGLGMLLHQAVPGFERWFGIRPEVTSELRDLIIADLEGK